MIRIITFVIIIMFLGLTQALAVLPGEQLSDPVLEQRAREVSKNLRCVVCQNQSIDDSNAELAADMRKLVRARILAGDSNEQVTQYIVDRYGSFVLLRPPLKKSTFALWFGPLGFVLVGGFVFWQTSRRTHKQSNESLDNKTTKDQ
ncbi:cytochrome c-type biogenesis protein CcmH [Oceanicaulis sp. AH-315-P02]|nr:cytochrome c-type biogenesis protein CcmH [Robiginitomaculum sp.]MBN4047768.1 cytochrome c-type biogenesis protein CcmH [Oceanicaulis sp. AH-315-P02]